MRIRRLLGHPAAIWREVLRRLAVAALLAPAALLPRASTRLLAWRWRVVYAAGFIRGAFGQPDAQAHAVGLDSTIAG